MSEPDFDDILIKLGTGRWNLFLYTAVGLCGFMVPAFVLNGSFLTPMTKFHCVSSDLANVSATSDECSYQQHMKNGSQFSNVTVEQKCTRWEFDTDVFPTSLTSEFELVCENMYLRPTYQTVYMMGNFISAPINGFLSDRFGRKALFSAAVIFGVGTMLVSSCLTNFSTLLVLRFMTGFSHAPIIQTGYILGMEACEPKMRSVVGVLLWLPWAIGTMWWGAIGYLIDDWRWMLRGAVIPGLIFMCFFLWFIDESPRWLIVVGEHSKALKILKKAAKWNAATLPKDEELLAKMEKIQKSSCSKVEEKSNSLNSDSNSWHMRSKQILNYIFVLFRTPELRRITLLMYAVFFVGATVFYGLTLNAVNFKLNPYMYMVVGGLTEIPAYTITIPIVMKTGRINLTLVSFLICGLTIVALAFIPSEIQWLVITLAMIGKFCISTAYQIVYLIASEVFPTEVRLRALGTANFVSRIGSILAPYVTEMLGVKFSWLPSILFGSISLCAAFITFFIPETMNKPLPETIQQLEEEALDSKNRYKKKEEILEERKEVKV